MINVRLPLCHLRLDGFAGVQGLVHLLSYEELVLCSLHIDNGGRWCFKRRCVKPCRQHRCSGRIRTATGRSRRRRVHLDGGDLLGALVTGSANPRSRGAGPWALCTCSANHGRPWGWRAATEGTTGGGGKRHLAQEKMWLVHKSSQTRKMASQKTRQQTGREQRQQRATRAQDQPSWDIPNGLTVGQITGNGYSWGASPNLISSPN